MFTPLRVEGAPGEIPVRHGPGRGLLWRLRELGTGIRLGVFGAAFACRLLVAMGCWGLVAGAVSAGGAEVVPVLGAGSERFAAAVEQALAVLPAPEVHLEGMARADLRLRVEERRRYEALQAEKLERSWYAALVAEASGERYRVLRRFVQWREFADFLTESEPLVEVWEPAVRAGGARRRLTAFELAERERDARLWPVEITLSWGDEKVVGARRVSVEFGFGAARQAREAHAGYLAHRRLQQAVHGVLGARNGRGRIDPASQWAAMEAAVARGELPAAAIPGQPPAGGDPYVAVEYRVDAHGNFRELAGWHRAGGVRRRIREQADGWRVPVVELDTGIPGEPVREVMAFMEAGVSGRLEPVTNVVSGQSIEMRVRDAVEADPRRWNVVEFGEAVLLQRDALARFSLVQAHVDLQRKRLAVKRSKVDLFVEPVVAGLNIGGGIVGLGFPYGDAVRLAYNLISPMFIANAPKPAQLKQLFALLAAKVRDPALAGVPERYLDDASIERLRAQAAQLTEEEIEEALQNASDADLEAMTRLARFQQLDATYSNLMNILTSAGKVSGVTERDIWRDIFNNPYFSMSGELNISTMLLAAIGRKDLTVMSGVSLESLADGTGPSEAWAQFFTLSVDVRAVINTIAQLSKRTFAEKELERPFPHAPRLDDLAAYEFRAFGFPLLMFYKRKLTLADAEAYENDYAYGLLGTRVVERFRTREEMEAEVRAGRMAPLGYVRVRTGRKQWTDTSLAVFVHRIPSGRHAGKTALILYGLKAFEEQSATIARERARFVQFEQLLKTGGLIEQWQPQAGGVPLATQEMEPTIRPGTEAGESRYAPLLGALLELRRLARLERWQGRLEAGDVAWRETLRQRLATLGLNDPEPDPLEAVNPFYSSFTYRDTDPNGTPRLRRLTWIPGFEAIGRALERAERGEEVEAERLRGLGAGGAGVVLLNEAVAAGSDWRLGPLVRGADGRNLGTGVRVTPSALSAVFEAIDRLPLRERVRLVDNEFRTTRLLLDGDGDGRPEPVFLTVEFPPGRSVERTVVDAETGVPERRRYVRGRLVETIRPDRIVRIEHDAEDLEVASKLLVNLGSLAEPRDGVTIETTRTLEAWLRAGEAGAEAALESPRIAKLRVNRATGELAREVYGVFERPLRVVDENWVTRNEFDAEGRWLGSTVSARSAVGRGGGLVERIRALAGSEPDGSDGSVRYRFERAEMAALGAGAREIQAGVKPFVLRRRDLAMATEKFWVRDLAAGGRLVAESFSESGEGLGPWTVLTRHRYRPEFQAGLVPAETVVGVVGAERAVRTARSLAYDVERRELRASVQEATGSVTTNTWVAPDEAPVRIESALRTTEFVHGVDGLSFRAETRLRSLGGALETVRDAVGGYDVARRLWTVGVTNWYGAGVATAPQVETRLPYGWLVAVRSGDRIESRPVYDASAVETARRSYAQTTAGGPFDLLQTEETAYRPEGGGRRSELQRFLAGQPYDRRTRVYDAEGRLLEESGVEIAGQSLVTRFEYDGASERVARSETLQGGRVRAVSVPGMAVAGAAGRLRLPVVVTPAWGLVSTQWVELSDPAGRVVAIDYESGDRIVPTAWYEAGAIARVAEKSNRHGRVIERTVRRLSGLTYGGAACDLLDRLRVGFWGQAGAAETVASVRGTDVEVWAEAGGNRTWFDLTRPFRVPSYTTSVDGRRGIDIALRDGRVVRCVETHVFEDAGRGARWSTVDLTSLFAHRVRTRTLDAAGAVLAERIGYLPVLGEVAPTQGSIEAALVSARYAEDIRYRHEPGFLVEGTHAVLGVRQMTFARALPAGARGEAVNDGGRAEWVTEIENLHMAEPGAVGEAQTRRHFSRRLRDHAEIETNPWLPNRPDVWTLWRAAELSVAGDPVFESDVCFDSQGEAVVEAAYKRTAKGRPALKVAYRVPTPAFAELRRQAVPAGRPVLGLDLSLAGAGLAHADFLYCYAAGTNGARPRLLRVRGGGSRVAEFVVGGGAGDSAARQSWVFSGQNVRWSPDDRLPELGLSMDAPWALKVGEGAVGLALADLREAGVDPAAVSAIEVEFEAGAADEIGLSPAYVLTRGLGAKPAGMGSGGRRQWVARTASGFELLTTEEVGRGLEERLALEGVRMTATFQGQPVGVLDTLTGSGRPRLTVLDASDPSAPRPLYALNPETGFLEHHYQVIKRDVSRVYTIVSGFEIPRYEVFRPGVLEDEVGPGLLAMGRDYGLQIEVSRRRGELGQAVATVENRLAANVFRNLGEQWLESSLDSVDPERAAGALSYRETHEAPRQAEALRTKATLAQTLLSAGSLPWNDAAAVPAALTMFGRDQVRALALQLLSNHVADFSGPTTVSNNLPGPGTHLIKTDAGTALDRYVDTVREADLIRLAARVGEHGLARSLLEFYWQETMAGTRPVHASYHGDAGTAMQADGPYLRPLQSKRTAAAQIAMAEAAFDLGFRTEDARWIGMGRSLMTNLLVQFRPAPNREGRGIAETAYLERVEAGSVAAWPAAARFGLASNARAFLLVDRLAQSVALSEGERAAFAAARDDLADWLRRHCVAQLERDGVVARGLFEIQDIHHRTSALGVERWTDPEGWLWCIEAAGRLGATRAQQRLWLDNLARVHGVEVGGFWGLDWSLPLLRPPAVSPELTALFVRVALGVDHGAAARYAQAQLLRMARNGAWPTVIAANGIGADRFATGQGRTIHAVRGVADTSVGWPVTPVVAAAFVPGPEWATGMARAPVPPEELPGEERNRTDFALFLTLAGAVYVAVFAVALFWWRFRRLRPAAGVLGIPDNLVSAATMRRAEERWAKRVLGVTSPAGAPHTRFSNAPVEMNFHMQFRAIYKLVLEWRRQENEWGEDDPRLVEDESDEWLNGMDEFASVVGIYMRFVIKAGAKDGRPRQEFLKEHEDSNHIWSRLVMYFSEYHWGLMGLVRQYSNAVLHQDRAEFYGQIARLLEAMGARQRVEGCDARKVFNCPGNPSAMDILVIQKPGATLEKVFLETARRLKVPYSHLVEFVRKYKEFKAREEPYPIHPYVIEMAKLVPHFGLMALGALVWYNQSIGDRPIVAYLWSVLEGFAFSGWSLLWAVPLLAGIVTGFLGSLTRIYRFDARMMSGETSAMVLDATLTSLFVKKHSPMPQAKTGWRWDPRCYEWASWALRCVGCTGLALALFLQPAPSFVTFLITKGILAMIALLEVACIVGPLATSWFSKRLQDYVGDRPGSPVWLQFLNRLNITATRPASPLWLSLRYHFKPSVPSGDRVSMLHAILVYFLMAGTFFFVGAFLCQEILSLWFTEKYVAGQDWRLLVGGLLFWNTMYLLRYGLFLMATGLATALTNWPIKTLAAAAGGGWVAAVLGGWVSASGGTASLWAWVVGVVVIGLCWFEERVVGWVRGRYPATAGRVSDTELERQVAELKRDRSAHLGVVYMSGDDLSQLKLTPALLMGRWQVMRDQLGAEGIALLSRWLPHGSDAELEAAFKRLYDAETAAGVTLWHPAQIRVADVPGPLDAYPGLSIQVADEAARRDLLRVWHGRRWLVTMMSTAGHAQDTAITLVDTAIRLHAEGLADLSTFYLLQNKYDNNDNNRPSQTPYDKGELGQREKLAALLEALAPGVRAFSLQNWTPFGFKAGGLTGMDLVHERSLELTTMLVLDRNANVNDMDGLMYDIKLALADPELIIVIPGRGTTNTRTPMGQASQLVEEGHRSFLKGLMGVLGGRASEAVGTGWGNLLACYYGRVQKAMVDTAQAKMPLTSRMRRGSSFAVRTEGLIGFTPHAVGISEDTWAVSQTMHNAVALGRRVKFAVSRAMWHKIRETWSHSEWLASFPRWSGGYLQMMHDPIMQEVNDFGPLSVFAKEVRANSGRNFLTAIFALANVLLMPLAILLDLTPFVQILIVLWNFGFVMNQILTVHGLHAYLEGAGFLRPAALAGGALAGATALAAPAWAPPAAGCTVLGFLVGGFFTGLARWAYTRVRDVLLFGPQLVLNAMGQVVRQTLEFTVSGASPEDARGVNIAYRASCGPREDRPQDRFPNLLNLRTVIWVFGLASLVLNVFALSNLDMLNALLLLPSLLFSISVIAGPFLLRPRPGRDIGGWLVVPRFAGWLAAILLATAGSMWMARGAGWKMVSVGLFAGALVVVLGPALRYVGYGRRLGSLTRRLGELLAAGGIEAEAARKLAGQLMPLAGGGPGPIEKLLEAQPLSVEGRTAVLEFVQGSLRRHFRAPVDGPRLGRFAQSRFISEFNRAFVLACLTLVWLLIVPIPGILVFTAGDYRLSLGLEELLAFLVLVIGTVVFASWVGHALEWWQRAGLGGRALRRRAEVAYREFEAFAARSDGSQAAEVSRLYGLFTDFTTYLDQRSLGYARDCLVRIERSLRGMGTVR